MKSRSTQGLPALSVLVVDDYLSYADALSLRLNTTSELRVVGAVDCSRALRASLELNPDVVLMDPGIGQEGIGLLQKLHSVSTRSSLVMMTCLVEDVALGAAAFGNGALGWIGKDAPAADMLGAIKQAAAGHAYAPPGLSGHPLIRTQLDYLQSNNGHGVPGGHLSYGSGLASRAELRPPGSTGNIGAPTRQAPRRRRLVAACLALMVVPSVSTAVWAESSDPGDLLFGVKLFTEQIRVAVEFDPADSVALRLRMAERRFEEILEAARRGRTGFLSPALENLAMQLQSAVELIESTPVTERLELLGLRVSLTLDRYLPTLQQALIEAGCSSDSRVRSDCTALLAALEEAKAFEAGVRGEGSQAASGLAVPPLSDALPGQDDPETAHGGSDPAVGEPEQNLAGAQGSAAPVKELPPSSGTLPVLPTAIELGPANTLPPLLAGAPLPPSPVAAPQLPDGALSALSNALQQLQEAWMLAASVQAASADLAAGQPAVFGSVPIFQPQGPGGLTGVTSVPPSFAAPSQSGLAPSSDFSQQFQAPAFPGAQLPQGEPGPIRSVIQAPASPAPGHSPLSSLVTQLTPSLPDQAFGLLVQPVQATLSASDGLLIPLQQASAEFGNFVSVLPPSSGTVQVSVTLEGIGSPAAEAPVPPQVASPGLTQPGVVVPLGQLLTQTPSGP
ncbi:MAG: DUF5667 domain-containing protein [Actinomycetota bacterium]